jgi:NAD(P)-dependent dehydrogenase (short-subunit alcohol dehydrogenase family)
MELNLAPELAQPGIAINAIAPCGSNIDMAAEYGPNYTHPALRGVPTQAVLDSKIALGRTAEPAEIAAAAAFLACSDASYITGSTLEAAGGWI